MSLAVVIAAVTFAFISALVLRFVPKVPIRRI